LYKCKACGHQFIGGQLASKYNVSSKTIARDLDGMRYIQKISKYKQVVIQMDTTYWGHNFGLMVIKDSLKEKSCGVNMLLMRPLRRILKELNGLEGMVS